ncbi:LCP family protein [Corynebacterium caspium]|uniref:LCP family protein n=1 Tax=Corynebacterium caspium TaxID=234828 RepID=UPI00039FD1A0|nr:LCP family protein [Corynebacterium caspium]WKD59729.1 Transcriptional regulator LytR [Corynebacterium caspium DSM 44850]
MNDKPRRTVRDIQPAPNAPTTLRQTGHPAWKTLLAGMSATVLLVSGLGYFSVGKLGNQVASAGNLTLGGGAGIKNNPDGATDILLVGSDSRVDAQGNPLSEAELAAMRAGVSEGEHNTDTLMVIRVPNDGSSATAVSIPRDTYIADPDYGNMKINGVFSAHANATRTQLLSEGISDERTLERKSTSAGREGLIRAINTLTGVEVDHYAEVGLLGFVLLTDALGGVDVCLNEAVYDEFSGANFAAGRQTLDGLQALSFVRQRHGLPRGDLDRVVRQQAFMASMVNKVLSAGTLTSPSRLSELSQAAERSLVIDENWDIVSFATQLSNLAAGNVTFSTIPVTSVDGVGDYGESIVTVDISQVHRFMEELLGPEDAAGGRGGAGAGGAGAGGAGADANTPAGTPVTAKNLHILNAGGPTGLAAAVGGYLSTSGHTIAEVANAQPGVYSQAQIVAADADDPEAQALALLLGGLPVTSNAGLDNQTLIVVTATDYQGPTGDPATTIGNSAATELDAASTIGQPGADFGTAPQVSPEIDAGGDGPRCVN